MKAQQQQVLQILSDRAANQVVTDCLTSKAERARSDREKKGGMRGGGDRVSGG